jgi:hypothetical protein
MRSRPSSCGQFPDCNQTTAGWHVLSESHRHVEGARFARVGWNDMAVIGGMLARARMIPVAVVAATALLGTSGVACARHISQRLKTPLTQQASTPPTAQRSASQAVAPVRRAEEAKTSAARRQHQPPKPRQAPSEPDVTPASPPVGMTGTARLTGSSSVVITPDPAGRVSSDPPRPASAQPAAGRISLLAGGSGRLFGALSALLAGAVAVLWLVTRR